MESGGGQRRRTSIYHGQRGSGIQIQLGMQCIITDNESQSQVTMSGGHSHNSVTRHLPAAVWDGWCGLDAGQKQTQGIRAGNEPWRRLRFNNHGEGPY